MNILKPKKVNFFSTIKLRQFLIGACLLNSALFTSNAKAEISWQWSPDYSAEEKLATKAWIVSYKEAIEKQFGPYPFNIRIGFHRRNRNSNKLDIFGMTDRAAQQGVDFYIDSPSPLRLPTLLSDWTAAHELSHLLLPYVGRKNAWFSEGFASYMQYKVMADAGQISEKSRWDKYKSHISRAAERYQYGKAPFISMVNDMREERDWPMIHWGGVSYFINAERKLNRMGRSIEQTVANYMACCRPNSSSLDELLLDLDQQSKSTVFTALYQDYKNNPGFPDYQSALNELSKTSLRKVH